MYSEMNHQFQLYEMRFSPYSFVMSKWDRNIPCNQKSVFLSLLMNSLLLSA